MFDYFVFRIVVFSINLLKDERLVLVAEQKPDSSEEVCFKWMGNVVQVHWYSYAL